MVRYPTSYEKALTLIAGIVGSVIVAPLPSHGMPRFNAGDEAASILVEVRSRARDRKIYLPVGPAYIYYDYPYYYRRGYYVRHIPGYAYYTFYPSSWSQRAGLRKCLSRKRWNGGHRCQ